MGGKVFENLDSSRKFWIPQWQLHFSVINYNFDQNVSEYVIFFLSTLRGELGKAPQPTENAPFTKNLAAAEKISLAHFFNPNLLPFYRVLPQFYTENN